jgi:hypothetical protein
MPAEASGEDLMYISDPGVGGIEVRSYAPPRYRLLGLIPMPVRGGYSYLCLNKEQDLFATGSSTVFEYKHGAMSPFRILGGIVGFPYGCAVDPVTGTLAVANDEGYPLQIAEVSFFKKNRGTHTTVSLPESFKGAQHPAYDGSGDLFVGAVVAGSPPRFALLELPKDKKQFVEVTLDETFSEFGNGGMVWDGTYLDIADFEKNVIYQFAIAGTNGTTKATITLQRSYNIGGFFVEGSTLIAPAFSKPSPGSPPGPGLVNLYNYPAGGKKTGVIRGVSYPWSVVVSLARSQDPK